MGGRKLPSLTALRSFEVVARTLSFTKAAEELGVTQAAVSRQIKNLERELAVELVSRRSTKNALTDAGDLLFDGIYRAFETIAGTVDKITDTGDREILTISVAPYLSAQWLTPHLMEFLAVHPEIDLRLHHSYHPSDHRREGIDIGINWGSGEWPGVEKIKVVDGSLEAVASPALIEKIGVPVDPNKLLGQPLFYEFDLQHWRLWFENAHVKMPDNFRGQRISDSHALRRAIVDGHGVGLFFSALLDEDVAAGQLIRLQGGAIHTGYDYYLNYPRDVQLPKKARAFMRFILAKAGIRG
ncbi:LysR substrate-binding domain-containing protein [Labrys neptuniae]